MMTQPLDGSVMIAIALSAEDLAVDRLRDLARRRVPGFGSWLHLVSTIARDERIPLAAVLGGSEDASATLARSRAFDELVRRCPSTPVRTIARALGLPTRRAA